MLYAIVCNKSNSTLPISHILSRIMIHPLSLDIIIPCYNSERTIQRTIKCLVSELEQAESSIEGFTWQIIIVNDGSIDRTKCILEELRTKRINIYEKNNSGVSATRNYGLKKAKSDYIWFFDADDLIFRGAVNILVRQLCKRPDILKFSSITVDSHVYSQLDNYNNNASASIIFDGKLNCFLDKNLLWFSCWSVIVKRDLLLKNNICFDENLYISEDVFWNLNIADKCPGASLIVTDLNVVKYMVTDNSAVNTSNPQKLKSHLDATLLFFQKLINLENKSDFFQKSIDYYKQNAQRQMITRLLSCDLTVNEIRQYKKKINMCLNDYSCQNKILQFYKLISKSSYELKFAQILYRGCFLSYIKPHLGRN